MKGLKEEEIYYEVSTERVNKIKGQAIQRTLNSLSPEERQRAERDMAGSAGIYGPISSLLSYADEEHKAELYGIGKLRPSTEDGKMLVTRILEQLKDLLCDEWGYCEKKKEYKDEWRFFAAAAAISVRTLSLEVGLVTGALLVALYKGPDFLCNCSKRGKEQGGGGKR